MSSESRIQLETWLKTIEVQGRVLDCGGAQNPIKGRTKSWEVEEYKILDLEQPHEIKVKPDIIMDIQEGDNYGSMSYRKYLQKFDIIFCIEVSEYWYRPHNALRNIHYFLKKGGILYISFHFQYKFHPPEGLDYLRYTPYGVEKLLKEAGFEIMEHKYRTTECPYLTMFYEYDKMRGKCNLNDNITGSLIKAKKM